MKTFAINCDLNEIPKAISFTKDVLQKKKVKKSTSVRNLLALEELLVKFIKNSSPEEKVSINVKGVLGGLALQVVGKGSSFDIDDIKQELLLQNKPSEDYDNDLSVNNVISSLVDHLIGDGISISNSKGVNRAVLKVRQSSLALQIFVALVFAVIAGILMQNYAELTVSYIKPFGTIFLNLVKFIVGPIVLFSIMSGIVSMKDIGQIGKIGGITVSYYMTTTAFAITIGLTVSSVFKSFFPVISTTELAYEVQTSKAGMDVFVDIFPSNFLAPIVNANMLQVIVMAMIIGFAIVQLGERAKEAVAGINLLNEIFMKCMEMILKLSPIGVFCLLTPVIASNGPEVIGSLAKVLIIAHLCFFSHALIVYSISVGVLGKISPLKFFKGILPAIMFAFSSASSVGTLPVNMECTEKLGVPRQISSFVLPLGATINMDGTAIYQGVCAIFIASCYGVDLTLPQMVTIVLTATLASIGTAGVPGAGMVMLAMVLTSVGLPVDGIALVAGVDRIFDMGRTTLNITGDASCAVIVSRFNKDM